MTSWIEDRRCLTRLRFVGRNLRRLRHVAEMRNNPVDGFLKIPNANPSGSRQELDGLPVNRLVPSEPRREFCKFNGRRDHLRANMQKTAIPEKRSHLRLNGTVHDKSMVHGSGTPDPSFNRTA
jgi:hypothetical protein